MTSQLLTPDAMLYVYEIWASENYLLLTFSKSLIFSLFWTILLTMEETTTGTELFFCPKREAVIGRENIFLCVSLKLIFGLLVSA